MTFLTRIETKNVEEAMDIAGHNFTVEKRRIHTEDGTLIPDHVAVMNTNTGQYLGTVGIGWIPVQPETIYDMAKHLIDSTNGKINGVFNMFGGSVIGISFTLAEREYIANDITELNFLMLTSFNGMYGIAGHATTNRMACLNQVNTSSKVYNLRHTKFVNNRLEVVKNILKYYDKEIQDFDKKMEGLVNKRMTTKDAIDWFIGLFPEPKSTKAQTYLERQTMSFLECLEGGMGSDIPGVKGTSYAAFQALTEYINHHRIVKVHGDRDREEVKFQSIHFGTNNALAQKGLRTLSKGLVTEFSENDFLID